MLSRARCPTLSSVPNLFVGAVLDMPVTPYDARCFYRAFQIPHNNILRLLSTPRLSSLKHMWIYYRYRGPTKLHGILTGFLVSAKAHQECLVDRIRKEVNYIQSFLRYKKIALTILGKKVLSGRNILHWKD